MAALLLLEQVLCCTARVQPTPTPPHIHATSRYCTRQGGLVANIVLPKPRKGSADSRLDIHPVTIEPAVQAMSVMSLMDSLDLLRPDADSIHRRRVPGRRSQDRPASSVRINTRRYLPRRPADDPQHPSPLGC